MIKSIMTASSLARKLEHNYYLFSCLAKANIFLDVCLCCFMMDFIVWVTCSFTYLVVLKIMYFFGIYLFILSIVLLNVSILSCFLIWLLFKLSCTSSVVSLLNVLNCYNFVYSMTKRGKKIYINCIGESDGFIYWGGD